jgi:sugar phosphate permease
MATAVRAPSRWFPFRRYGTVMAIISLSFLFGDAAARRFMGLLLANGLGWRGVFASPAAAAFLRHQARVRAGRRSGQQEHLAK